MFRRFAKPVVGLDVGSQSVKMVGLRKQGAGYEVLGAAIRNIESPDSSFDSMQTARLAAIRGCLKDVDGSICRSSFFVFGLSWPHVKVSGFDFKSLAAFEVDQAVKLEAAQVCPFDVRESVIDYHLIDCDGNGPSINKKQIYSSIKGVLAVATKDAVRNNQNLMQKASLKCVLGDSQGLALLNCISLCDNGSKQGAVAIVNVGKSLTTIAILGDDGLPFIRDIGYSGSDIIKAVAKGTNLDVEDVEFRIMAGAQSSEFSSSVHIACKKLIGDLSETLAYYAMSKGGIKIERIYVSGGFSQVDDFVKALAGSLDAEISVWNPFDHLDFHADATGEELAVKYGSSLTVAAGLAMRAV